MQNQYFMSINKNTNGGGKRYRKFLHPQTKKLSDKDLLNDDMKYYQ